MITLDTPTGNLIITDKVGDTIEFTNATDSPCIVAKKGKDAFASVLVETVHEDLRALRDWIDGYLGEK